MLFMHVGNLYAQAVDLSPRAARIAASMLVKEATFPEVLRKSLTMALDSCSQGSRKLNDAPDAYTRALADDTRDVRAAKKFVAACMAVCARG
jgi:hypothetical protein